MGKIYVVGLGNPGKEYAKSRHNAGFMVVDRLAMQWKLSWVMEKKANAEIAVEAEKNVVLAKPQTFMNDSGSAVKHLLNYGGGYDALYLVYDDLDIALGNYKIVFDKMPKIHNGVNSVSQALEHQAFWHVRIGIDTRQGSREVAGKEYVLQQFSSEDQKIFDQSIETVVQELHAKILTP